MVSIFDRGKILADRLAHAWNAFTGLGATNTTQSWGSFATGINPSRNRMIATSDRSIISSIYTRIGIDGAAITLGHVKLDANKRYLNDMPSGLNDCLTLSANTDQAARAFKQDMIMSLCDKGTIAIVPVDTSDNPLPSGSWDILSMRVGEIIAWYPQSVRVRLYNEKTGIKSELTLPKNVVAVVENPLYSVMNEPNSTYQRLIRKLNLLDAVDEAAGSGKLDIIIQLPYVLRTETRKEQADDRARDIANQLQGSKYGIAYTDASEKITQLNRPAENNMLAQIQFLTGMLYSQLGLAEAVFDGTADQKIMLNYYNRTVEPILAAIAEAMKRTFLTKTARTQGQSIEYYRDPFKLLTLEDLGNLVDKLSRNEILTGNEIRALLGYKPSSDPNADKLLNKNLPIQSQSALSALASQQGINPAQAQAALATYPQSPGAIPLPAGQLPLAITAGPSTVADIPMSSLS